MRLVEVTAPTVEPVLLEEAKNHLRVDIQEDDPLIDAYIQAARQWCEAFTRKAFITQTWDVYFDAWPDGRAIWFPKPPLQSVTSVKYTDEDGIKSTLSSSDYIVSTGTPGLATLKASADWPSDTLQAADGVVVRFVAGFGDAAENVPEQVRQSIRLLLGHMYENRETVVVGTISTSLPFAVEALLWPQRHWLREF